MPTTGVINTTDLEFYSDGVAFAHAKNATITINHATRDTTSKASGAWVDRKGGQLSWSGSGTGLMSYDGTEDAAEVFGDITGRTAIEIRFSTEVTGDDRYFGDVYITDLTLTSDGEQSNAEYSFSFEGTGAISKEAVT